MLLLAAFGWSCTGQNQAVQKYSQSLIILERTACYGTCPVYTLQLEGNGNAYLHNKQHAEPAGKYKAVVPVDSLEAIFKAFEKTDWSQFNKVYDDHTPDLPMTVLTWYHAGYQKEIRIVTKHPEELDVLISRADKLKDKLKWSWND